MMTSYSNIRLVFRMVIIIVQYITYFIVYPSDRQIISNYDVFKPAADLSSAPQYRMDFKRR